MTQEFELIAKTFMGLEPVLAKELTQLGANEVQIGRRMVSFMGDKEMMYRANFQLHTAIRILKPIKHFKALSADDVYREVQKIDWSEYIGLDKTFAVDSVVFSEEFRHSKFVAYKVKDAIVLHSMDELMVELEKYDSDDDYKRKEDKCNVANEIKSYFKNHKSEIEFIPFQDCGDIETQENSDDYMSEDEFEELLSKTQKKILSVLNEDEKKVFIKLYIEKKTVKTVSEETGLTPNNIYVKSHRLKNKAKKIISTTDLLINIIIFKFF